MSNERYNQIIDEVYRKYADSHKYFVDGWMHVVPMEHSKETFVNECKTNPKFSNKWGLKIEERELTYEERVKIACKQENGIIPVVPMYGDWDPTKEKMNQFLNENKTPTKLITLTYNNEKIESYE